ncbi:unnamed protein product [Adineta steineri]|uniref:Uncharacterized protein n=1 Tax=Adineta steineri TaxID=433720 RepID=A0A813SZR9_9BILA|nr:unnamed protein product [Adineta steineri]
MVDIARVFSPVVVLDSSEARPKSTDRIRSASDKRISSADTHRISRISSAVSTIENNNGAHGRYGTNEESELQELEDKIKQELITPVTGINLCGLINDKISNLDRALKEVGASSDYGKKKTSPIAEKLRTEAIRNGQSRQQVQKFATMLTTKAAEDQAIATLKSKQDDNAPPEQSRTTLLEVFKYPGFDENQLTPLPFHVSLERQIMRHILSQQYTHLQQAPYIKSLIQLYHSAPTKALILDIFWWIFLDNYQNQPETQKKLLNRASNNYISLLMMEIDLRYRDKSFQVYPSLLAETVFACFKICFPISIKRMPADTDAAKKAKDRSGNLSSDLENSSDNFDPPIKEIVNLDQFKNSIANVCQLWLGGLPAPPRRYEQWRSKIVQQEKISFGQSATTTPTTHESGMNSNDENTSSNSHHLSFEQKKHKEPQERLAEFYKHTNDPLPDRRVLYDDYRFNLNGNSPLAENYLRTSHMLKKAGTQLFISHPQISQVPTVNAETYDKEIKRTAQFCRIVRAQKHKVRAEEEHHRKLVKEHVAKLKERDDLQKQEKQALLYRRKMMMNFHNDEFETMSQFSVKSHE